MKPMTMCPGLLIPFGLLSFTFGHVPASKPLGRTAAATGALSIRSRYALHGSGALVTTSAPGPRDLGTGTPVRAQGLGVPRLADSRYREGIPEGLSSREILQVCCVSPIRAV